MGRVKGTVALVTGGARGMGASHALTLAGEGADVAIVDLPGDTPSVPYELSTPEDMERTRGEVEALGRRCLAIEGDVRSQQALDRAVDQTVAELGPIDILVANAGVWGMAPLWELSEDEWQEMIDINLTGVWKTLKAVAPGMIERRRGAVVLVSSANGLEAAYDYAHYISAKHGVIGLMRSAAVELSNYDIRCNAVCPGFIDTKINKWQGVYDMMAGHEGGTPEDRDIASRHWSLLPGRTALPPQAVSNAVLFLCSDEASEITGHEIPIDAGHMVLPGFNPTPAE